MESIEISKKSWHYRIATTYGQLSEWEVDAGTDICSYLIHFIGGFALICFIIIMSTVLLYCSIVDPLLWVITGFHELPKLFLVTFFVYCLIGWILFCKYALTKKVNGVEQPGLIMLAWRKFHEKVCFQIHAR